MKEIWKDVVGWGGLYKVSNLGRVKSIDRKSWNGKIWYERKGKILKGCRDKDGYCIVSLRRKNEHKTFKVHRLVAEAFIPNPDGYPQVNHKDENKINNCIKNLEWCSAKYNINYGTRNQRMATTNLNGKNSQLVNQLTKDGRLLKIWPSMHEAARSLKINQGNISNCCSGRCKSYAGYIWTRAN